MYGEEKGPHGEQTSGDDSLEGGVEQATEATGAKRPAMRALRSPAYANFEVIDLESEKDGGLSDKESELASLIQDYEEVIAKFEEGQIVQGVVTEVREKEVIVDVGFKSEGSIPISEFRDLGDIEVGEKVDVFLEKMENQEGLVVLSKEKADFFRVWDEIREAYNAGRVMDGRVTRRIKGGLVVNLLGVDAFLPGSQIALRQVPNLGELIGQSLSFKIIKINKRRRNIVVSRRIVLEEERQEQKRNLLNELEIGQIREGIVKNITDFGAFVDLGGVDGLLHLTDMTWGRISHPSEVLAIGNKLKVKVLDFNKEREKISLGLKQLSPYPWDGVEERYPVGSKIRGKVVSLTDYGAFVELERGVEGLIHISEMSWTRHVKHPSKVLEIGETVDAIVLKVDKDHQKISLGLKQVEPDPWSTIEQKYPPGTRITGKVRNLTNFGAFVEIEDGIDGLLHISDMSWARRVRHPGEIVKKGDRIEVVVLDINQDKKRVSLGMKQLTDNPWEKLASEFASDTVTEGKITRILDRGAVVELRTDVEGFVPVGQMGKEKLKHPNECFALGDVIPLRVIKIDPKNKRIVLSVSSYLKTLDEEGVTRFHEKFPMRKLQKEEEKEEREKPREKDSVQGVSESSKEVAPPEEASPEKPAPEEAPPKMDPRLKEEKPAPGAQEDSGKLKETSDSPSEDEKNR